MAYGKMYGKKSKPSMEKASAKKSTAKGYTHTKPKKK